MRSPKQKGFTLIELLVVIAIIGVLTAIGIASFQGAQQKARDAKRIGDLKEIQTALQAFYNDNGFFPGADNTIYGSNSSTTSPWIPGLTSQYIKTLPVDPINTSGCSAGAASCYVYGYFSSKCSGSTVQNYVLFDDLENTTSTAPGYPPSPCDFSTLYTSGSIGNVVILLNP